MKNNSTNQTNLLAILFVCCAASSIAQGEQERIWTTIQLAENVPEWKNEQLYSGNREVQQLIDAFNITSVEQVVPTSTKEDLRKVYEVSCNCDATALIEVINDSSTPFSQAVTAPSYELLQTPNDYNYSFQVDYALDLIQAKDAWQYSTGDPTMVIGISDANYYNTHEDLESQIEYLDPVNYSTNYYHGTAVAISAAGHTNNGTGKSSIGYECKLWLSTMGYGKLLQMSQSGIRLINISWASGCGPNPYEENIIDEIYENGTILVAAAGNGSTCGGPTNLVFPAAYKHVISVTSVGETDNHESIIGDPTSTHQHNNEVDLCAPGYNVPLSIAPGFYFTSNGTSFAAPLVTGTVGLMLSLRPCLNFEEVREILRISADDIYATNQLYYNQLGAGRLNAGEALRLTEMYSCGSNSAQVNSDAMTANNKQSKEHFIEVLAQLHRDREEAENTSSFSESSATHDDQPIMEMSVFPNPSFESTTLYSNINSPMQLVIIDMQGAVVRTQELLPGKTKLNFNIAKKGVYTLKLISDNQQTWFRRFTKL